MAYEEDPRRSQYPPPPPNDAYERQDFYPRDIYHRPRPVPPPGAYYREEVPKPGYHQKEYVYVHPDYEVENRSVSSDMYRRINRPDDVKEVAKTDRMSPRPVYEERSKYYEKEPIENYAYPKDPYRRNDFRRYKNDVRPQILEERRSEYYKTITNDGYPLGVVRSFVESYNGADGYNYSEPIYRPPPPYYYPPSPNRQTPPSRIPSVYSRPQSQQKEKRCCRKKAEQKSACVMTNELPKEEIKPVLKIIQMRDSSGKDEGPKFHTFWASSKNQGASTAERPLENYNILSPRKLKHTKIVSARPRPKVETSCQTNTSFLLKSCMKKAKKKDLSIGVRPSKKEFLGKAINDYTTFVFHDNQKFRKEESKNVGKVSKETETVRLMTDAKGIQTSGIIVANTSKNFKDDLDRLMTHKEEIHLSTSMTSYLKSSLNTELSSKNSNLKNLSDKSGLKMTEKSTLKNVKPGLKNVETSKEKMENEVKKGASPQATIRKILKESNLKTDKDFKKNVSPCREKNAERSTSPCRASLKSGFSFRGRSPVPKKPLAASKGVEKRSIYKCGALRPETSKPHNWQCFMMQEQRINATEKSKIKKLVINYSAKDKCDDMTSRVEVELKHLKNQLRDLRNQWANFSGGSVIVAKERRTVETIKTDPNENWVKK